MVKRMEVDKTTESLILEAAKVVFISKGFDGARMQEIADEANINKALLHYYFRSKDHLFEAVFRDALQKFFPRIIEILNSESDVKEKIVSFINAYNDMLFENQYLPMFVLYEIGRNSERFFDIIMQSGVNAEKFIRQIKREIKEKKIRKVSAEHLLVNMLSLCIFPYIGKPVIKGLLFNNDKVLHEMFLKERKEQIKQLILNSITL